MSDSAQLAKQQKRVYDEVCKQVLSERSIIARILKACTEEFRDCDVGDIEKYYIQGNPAVSRIAVEPGSDSPRIETQQMEDKAKREGTV